MKSFQVFCALLFFSIVPAIALASNGILYVAPDFATHAIGDTFEEKVLVDTDGAPINAAEAELSFNPAALSVVSVSTTSSILSTFATPPQFSNADGTIKFTGWTKQNYTGKEGLLITITFKALRNMTSNAELTAGAILAADQGESNIITYMRSATFTTEPDKLPLPTAGDAAEANTSTSTTATSSESIAQQDDAPAPVEAPVFSQSQYEFTAGDHLIIKGTASPDSHLTIYLAEDGALPELFNIATDADGAFTFVSSDPAREGSYTLWAQAQDVHGEPSPVSQKISISVHRAPLEASVAGASSVFMDLAPLFAIVLGALIASVYLGRRPKH